MKSSSMKVILSFLGLAVSICLTACSPFSGDQTLPSAAPPLAETTATSSKPTNLDILKEMDPTFGIFIDGEECEVDGQSEIKFGEYLFVLHNDTDLPASMTIGSYFSEGSSQDHSLWREENCGGQGAHCEAEEGTGISYSLATWYNPKKLAQDEESAYIKLFEVNMEREYVIWVYSDHY